MPQHIFVTGGSGFVGTAVIRELLDRGHTVRAQVHRGELKIAHERLVSVRDDIFSQADLAAAMAACDAVIHLIGIIRESPRQGVTFERMHVECTRSVVDATVRAGIARYIHMSAQGARPDAPSRYHQTKAQAERYVHESGLDWTIFRPSLIHGAGGEFTHMLAAWAHGKAAPYFFMPYFGAGILGTGHLAKVQPIAAADVARAFADAGENPKSVRQTFDLGGSEQLTWPQMYRIAAEKITGKRRAVLAIPDWYALTLTYLAPQSWLPFNRDQVLMAREDNTAQIEPFVREFGWRPGSFSETFSAYANSL